MLSRAEAPFLIAATASYLAAMLLMWAQLFLWPKEREGKARWCPGEIGRLILWVGCSLHLVALAGQGPSLFLIPAGKGGMFGWILIVSYLMIGQKLGAGSGSVVAPIALVAALYSLTASPLHIYSPNGRLDAYWLAAHVLVILAGYAALAFAFAASLLYLVQENLLKRKQLSGLWQKLPSLQVADEWIYRATTFGLALLTLGLFLGVAFSALQDSHYQPFRDPKVLFSVATWTIFMVYLLTRLRLGWHGRKSNLVVIYGFVVMAISFLGVPHVMPSP